MLLRGFITIVLPSPFFFFEVLFSLVGSGVGSSLGGCSVVGCCSVTGCCSAVGCCSVCGAVCSVVTFCGSVTVLSVGATSGAGLTDSWNVLMRSSSFCFVSSSSLRLRRCVGVALASFFFMFSISLLRSEISSSRSFNAILSSNFKLVYVYLCSGVKFLKSSCPFFFAGSVFVYSSSVCTGFCSASVSVWVLLSGTTVFVLETLVGCSFCIGCCGSAIGSFCAGCCSVDCCSFGMRSCFNCWASNTWVGFPFPISTLFWPKLTTYFPSEVMF